MNESDLRAVLPPERRLPADRRNDIKEMLMEAAREESAATPALFPRRRRRRLAGGVAVALAVAGLGTAAAATVLNRDRPDAREAATINDEIGSRSPSAEVHLEGWRPSLSAERVECVLPSGRIDTAASEFLLEDLLTQDALVQECVAGNDLARNSAQALVADSAIVCANRGIYPKPVVLLDGSSCEEHPQLRRLVDVDIHRHVVLYVESGVSPRQRGHSGAPGPCCSRLAPVGLRGRTHAALIVADREA